MSMSDLYHGPYPVDMTPTEALAELQTSPVPNPVADAYQAGLLAGAKAMQAEAKARIAKVISDARLGEIDSDLRAIGHTAAWELDQIDPAQIARDGV